LPANRPLGDREVRHPAGPGDDGVAGVLAKQGLQRRDFDAQSDGGEHEGEAARHPFTVRRDVATPDRRVCHVVRQDDAGAEQEEADAGDRIGVGVERHVHAAEAADRAGDEVHLAHRAVDAAVLVTETAQKLHWPHEHADHHRPDV
jgi:hypothetical protein